MNPYTLQYVSQDDFPAIAEAWDSLWRRSHTAQPTVTSRGLLLWHRYFAPNAEFRALVVHEGDELLAGLPLVSNQVFDVLPIWTLPTNSSVNAGDVLVDPNCRWAEALGLLARGLVELPHRFAIFDEIDVMAERWQRFVAALDESGAELSLSEHNQAGVVDILHDWDRYVRSWSANHRSAMKRCLKKLDRAGEITVERVRQPSDDVLEDMLTKCFELEHLGWKGQQGTSILGVDGMREYYRAEARMVRDLGMLDLWLLRLNGNMIAFEYCHFSKGTCFSHKLSFDPDFAPLSPGRILRHHQLRAYHDDPQAQLFDMLGQLCRSKASWATRSYSTGRCIIGTGDRWSNALLKGYRWTKPILRKIRGMEQQSDVQVGAARCLDGADEAHSADVELAAC